MSKKILFLTPYPQDTAGSQRFRFEQYYPALIKARIDFDSRSFMDENTWDILYRDGFLVRKAAGIFLGFLKRFWLMLWLRKYDFVFVHREATPIGFPIIEWIIAKVWKKSLIYDFDDAIWLENTSVENRLISWLKYSGKVNKIISWSDKVSAGNQFLMDHAKLFNSAIVYNPTTIDTANRHVPRNKEKDQLYVGWTGTHSSLRYLEPILDMVLQLSVSLNFKLLVIADKSPEIEHNNLEFIYWNKEHEIEDLNLIDIGLMPMENEEWANGKCGFKALQFMALEKPVLVSPVGVNSEVVVDGEHGYHCRTPAEWKDRLEQLIESIELRNSLGRNGRTKVMAEFSTESNTDSFLGLFN
ncbi:MAG: glycosyltransferase family 4 protein [Reichenbachiella sp.]|uniref:glycosyltransferase family 4 protein n=1 Tax=Reichenbachiella sp. TaxID=2184521 RepID=UPI003262E178